MDYNQLLDIATEARGYSYAPYSGYKVGAALLAKSGKVYSGCNIENASYSPSICAERTAFFKAISEGEKEFVAIAIVGGLGDAISDSCAPCGVCRQVMAEFVDNMFEIILKNATGYAVYHIDDLLPLSFTKKELW